MLINILLLLFLKIRILKNFWNFTRKHLFWSLFSIKLQKLLKNTFFYRTPLVAGCTIKSTKGNMGLGVILTIGTILTTWHTRKLSKYGVTSGPYFPVFGLNTGKYGPEITPYLETFHAVWMAGKKTLICREHDLENLLMCSVVL